MRRSLLSKGVRDRLLTRGVPLRWLFLVAVLVAVVATGVGFAAALAITPKSLTVHTAASTVPISTCTRTPAADSYVHASNGGNNFGTATTLQVRSAVALGLLPDDKRSFLRFDLSSCSIPTNARVETASLTLFLSTAPSASRTYELHRATASWGETTVTWNNQPAVAAVATGSVATGTTANVTRQWNVLADVRTFVDGTVANNGWRIKDLVEGGLLGNSFEGQFRSREHTTTSQRPTLAITYYP
jgi:hypothetical protein